MTTTTQTLAALAEQMVSRAQALGATGADALAMEADAFQVQVRLGEVENTTGARDKGIGLRVFHGHRQASASTSDFSPEGVERLVQDTVALARLTEEDPFSGLADPQPLTEFPELDLDDGGTDLSMDQRIDLALRAERAAMDADPRINNSEGASFDSSRGLVAYANSNGFSGSFHTSSYGLSAVPVATDGEGMQRDYWFSSRRHLADLENPEAVGAEAARRVLRRLGARKVSTCEVPIVFDRQMASGLLGHLVSATSGNAIYKGASFLADRIGGRVLPEGMDVIDDPLRPRGLGSRPFDGEGVACSRLELVSGGILKSYLLDSYAARKLSMTTTGSASRGLGGSPAPSSSNCYLAPGSHDPEAIIASVERGLYVTELIGFGVNGVTGDYSRGAAGMWIENGELAFPVEEVTISGNLLDMYAAIEMVGNDLDFTRRVTAPTLKVGRMTLAGD